MKILLITDQFEGSQHSSTEGIFNRGMKGLAEVTRVYFSRELSHPRLMDGIVILPYQCRKSGLITALNQVLGMLGFDIIIIRNWFATLKQCLDSRKILIGKIGFWESFPHSYRRIYEAKVEGRSILRKSLEYAIKRQLERRYLGLCDFYLPITATFHDVFYPNLQTPWMALPMGVDFSELPAISQMADGPLRFVYIGTVDRLRQVDVILNGFHAAHGDFVLDIYTSNRIETVRNLLNLEDPRIRTHSPLPRRQLFADISGHDVGVALIPDTPLYRVSSPTKTMEYFALGIPVLMNPLPEHTNLFPADAGIYCDFTQEAITRCVNQIVATPREILREIGSRGKRIVESERDYKVMANRLLDFLAQQT